jgi:glucose/mannose transport system substrate-binding protein
VLSTVSSAGKVYAVPLVVERDNNTYFNTAVLEENQVAPPESLQDFYVACETLQGNGVTPLALPAAGWMMALTAFETLMPTVNGGAFYTKFFSGNADLSDESADHAELVALFTELDDVLACSNVAQADGSWVSALDAVIAGDAAMAVMGDWGKHYLEQQGPWTAGNQFGVVPALGSSDYYVFNAAVFPLATGAAHPAAARAFLDVMASETGQLAFNEKKDAVPARLGVSLDGFDAMTRANAESYAAAAAGSNKLLPGYASVVSFDFQQEMNPALLVFAVGGERAKELDDAVPDAEVVVPQGNVDYIVTKIASIYSLL